MPTLRPAALPIPQAGGDFGRILPVGDVMRPKSRRITARAGPLPVTCPGTTDERVYGATLAARNAGDPCAADPRSLPWPSRAPGRSSVRRAGPGRRRLQRQQLLPPIDAAVYRTDCSATCRWRGVGLITHDRDLPRRLHAIARTPSDRRHPQQPAARNQHYVVLFAGWANAERTGTTPTRRARPVARTSARSPTLLARGTFVPAGTSVRPRGPRPGDHPERPPPRTAGTVTSSATTARCTGSPAARRCR